MIMMVMMIIKTICDVINKSRIKVTVVMIHTDSAGYCTK